MTGISPGRAAYEDGGLGPNDAPWEALTASDRRVWEDAAKAAISVAPMWPRCPDGCGCRLGSDDADRSDCGCDGPCTAECLENGYPDAPSYRDAAVKHAMDDLAEVRNAYRRVCEERDQLRSQVGAVYTERARIVAFLAACYESAQYLDQDDDEYRLVYLKTPAGQMSWHVRGDDAENLLGHVPHGEDDDPGWDGHTTEVKYERLADMTDRIARSGGFAGLIASMARPERTEPYPTAVERDKLRAALSSLTDRAEASNAITRDEADEYRKLVTL